MSTIINFPKMKIYIPNTIKNSTRLHEVLKSEKYSPALNITNNNQTT